MRKRLKSRVVALAAAIAVVGGLVLITGIVLSVASYSRLHPYSPTNHFISELGWKKMSPSAKLFNESLFVSCIAFLPMMYAMGRHIRTRLAYSATLCGVCMLSAGAAVSLCPMDDLKPHLLAAVVFFWAYFFTVALFTLAFSYRWNRTPSGPMVAVGVLCCMTALSFLVFPKESVVSALSDLHRFKRPDVWWLAVLEWGVLFSAYLWGSTAVFVLCREAFTPSKCEGCNSHSDSSVHGAASPAPTARD